MNVFIKRYKELGYEVKSVNLPVSIRTNTLKISNDELKKRLEKRNIKLKKIPFVKNGFYVQSRFSIASTPEHLLGLFYIQESIAQLPAEILNAKGKVLDCCASPGGKTSQLAETADIVVSLDIKHKRLEALANNLERLGVKNVIIYNKDARSFEGPEFDKILVDAPCSGNYIIEKDWFEKRDLKNVAEKSKLQKQILENMFNVLKQGGELVYSTCSLEPEENEFIVDWVLNNFDVKLMDLNLKIGSKGITNVFGKELNKEISKCRRFWPGKTKTQGFFIAKFKKNNG